MNALKQVFQDRAINNLIVAFIIATSTVSFIFFVGQQFLSPIFQDGAPGMGWSMFWQQFIMWIFGILVATGISTLAKGK